MNKGPNLLENIIGWVGAAMIVFAYGINALGFIEATTWTYVLLNLIGSFGVGFVAFKYRNYQSTIINLIWIVIALIALINLISLL